MAEYSTGLFECMKDCKGCLYTMFCFECAAAQNWADSRNEPCTICHLCGYACPIWTRSNIRKMLGQTDSHYTTDCFVYTFCGPCAVCQDTRQLDKINRGTQA
ncbi:putative Cys-rich domain containing protein [Histomonas meleagridis]|uniref:putative Cys-rich domain containing protein n=1 Tax=Histomonas meleagridis TaxID=135588 RepID=UPI00355A5D00|nr:putative Cys-rich domain containing protein [Histomonas meleagridis]KAH0802645.1 putative Cys-rich domain containing protein [Histomonas meleagridis]